MEENFGPKKERVRRVRYRYSDGGETIKESYIRKWYSINRPLSAPSKRVN
jgi:hypothetical protein